MSNLSPSRGLKRLATVAGASILLAAPAAHASTFMDTLANVSSTYNAYTSGAFTSSGSDTEGKIAAGGAVSLSSYAVGLQNQGGNALVAGGGVSFSNGTIYGNAVSGGAASYSNATVNGKVSAGGAISAPPSIATAAFTGLPLSFGQISADLASASTYLNSGAAQSQGALGTVLFQYSTLNFTSTATSGLVFFDVTAAQLANTNLAFHVNSGTTVIVNVTGQTDGTIGAQGFDGVNAYDTLFNFVDTTSLNLASFNGSVLATNAAVTASNGRIDGSLMAKSYSGGAQLNWYGFKGILPTVSAVPEPSSWAMMILGVGAIGAVLRKRRRDAGAPTLA